jgi:hypothetical protein
VGSFTGQNPSLLVLPIVLLWLLIIFAVVAGLACDHPGKPAAFLHPHNGPLDRCRDNLDWVPNRGLGTAGANRQAIRGCLSPTMTVMV